MRHRAGSLHRADDPLSVDDHLRVKGLKNVFGQKVVITEMEVGVCAYTALIV